MELLVALVVAVVIGLLVKVLLSLFDATARYADTVAVVVAALVFLSRSGLL